MKNKNQTLADLMFDRAAEYISQDSGRAVESRTNGGSSIKRSKFKPERQHGASQMTHHGIGSVCGCTDASPVAPSPCPSSRSGRG